MKTVIFDLDGTLADTSGDLIAAANSCFRTLGHGDVLDPVADALTAFHGGRAMLRLGFGRVGGEVDEALVDLQYPELLGWYSDNIDVHTRLYPGVEAALGRLGDAGYRLGICTNKPVALAELLVSKLGVRDRFGALLGADSLTVRKPDPEHLLATIRGVGGDPKAAVLIGDTITDRSAATNAGVPCVLVGFGPEGDAVSAMAPDALLAHYDDLDRVVAGLIG